MCIWEAVAIGSVSAAGVIGQVNLEPGTVEAFGKWPVTIALIGLAAFSIWRSQRTVEKQIDANEEIAAKNAACMDHMADKIGQLAENLAQRPCVRSPKND